jgi:tubulin-specific chaperone A
LALSLIPVFIVSLLSYQNATQSLREDAELALRTVAKLKTRLIDKYFSEILTGLTAQARSKANLHLLQSLIKSYKESKLPLKEFSAGNQWKRITRDQAADLISYRETFNYYDIFLIDTSGNILFTAAMGNDLGNNLFEGPQSASLFAAASKRALQNPAPVFSDYEHYTTEGEIYTSFVISAVSGEDGETIGLIVFQLPLSALDKIVSGPVAIGQTAETYLVGLDLKMRTNSILASVKTAMQEPVKTGQTLLWKRQVAQKTPHTNDSHSAFIYDGPHGKPVLGIHMDIDIRGIPFGLIAETGKAEAFASRVRLRNIVILLLAVTGWLVIFIALYISLRIVRPIRELSKGAGYISRGDLDHPIRIAAKNEIGELADSFNDMLENLRITKETNESQTFLMAGQTNLNTTMRGEHNLYTLGASIIRFLAGYLNLQVGLIYYFADDIERLKLVGSYAYEPRKQAATQFLPGEGLVGQVALEKKPLLLNNCPKDYININSGLGEAPPTNLLIYPIVQGNLLTGVIELGSLFEITDSHLEFLDRVCESIAIALNSVVARNRTSELLERTQQQAEELKVQQEELRQTNEELESHASALKDSEQILQRQQEELRQANEELEEKSKRLEIQKRNTDRKNQELKTARLMLEEKARDLEMSSRYKSEFLSNMSHELRTPLNSVLLLARLLADNKSGNLTDDETESASTIYSSGVELLHLINEVLDLSKVEAGRMDLRIEKIDPKQVAHSMKRHFQPLARQKKISFEVKIDDDLPALMKTDKQRAEQVIKNFLSNAFKFTQQGSITLHIHRPFTSPPDEAPDGEISVLYSPMDPDRSIAFSVIDTGPGIAKEKQKVIFEAFQQADGTTSRRYGGTGLGLSISKELTRLLGGEITMKSTPGAGSTFTLILPETYEPPIHFMPEAQSPETPESMFSPVVETEETLISITGASLPPVRPQAGVDDIDDDRRDIAADSRSLLIIEDDVPFLKVLKSLARKYGFKCLVAGDGETGLQFAEYYKPSAIILDIGLPRLDGWEVMNRLKENSETRHIPVHFITASDRQLDAMKMGAVDFLTKPVTPESLEQAYKRLDSIISKPVKDLLVVEDDPGQAQSISKLIGNSDVRITLVSSADEGYKEALSGKFDCMIMDIGLKDMEGIQLLDKIRVSAGMDHLPIIVYSGGELTEEQSTAIDDLAQSAIVKGAGSHQKLLAEATLFLHRVEVNLPHEKQQMLRMVYDKESRLVNKKVLLVDDDMRNVYSLKKMLESKTMKVKIGRNGKEGLKILNKSPNFDLVLMDIMMPEMDGYEAIREIRKQYRFKDLPIIALTAKAMRGDRSKCIEAGANDYLAKPVDTDRLFSMLRVWLY